ncbi:hypothetical protein QYM36_014964 [Artemia franciscana]|uniref:Uncharacterized protein n=1 Tax=Artemia franciscana TaxID=6661 RepID=A0AA88KU58_ARTSF|nr:hypothetical protein QYM36_014964 [Artemia franciscana]
MQSIDLKDSETFNFYDSGMTDGSRPHRVGLLLDPIAASSPISGQPVSARISDLGLEGQISNVTLLSAYAPIRDSPDDSKDAFYFELQRILDFVPGHNILFVAGGFKSRVLALKNPNNAHKMVKQSARSDRKKYWSQVASDMLQAAKLDSLRKTLKQLREATGKSPISTDSLKDIMDKFIQTEKDRL